MGLPKATARPDEARHSSSKLVIDTIDSACGVVRLEGRVVAKGDDARPASVIHVQSSKGKVSAVKRQELERQNRDGGTIRYWQFSIVVNVDPERDRIAFSLGDGESQSLGCEIAPGPFFPVGRKFRRAYAKIGAYLAKWSGEGTISIARASMVRHFSRELLLGMEMIASNLFAFRNGELVIRPYVVVNCIVRAAYFVARKFRRREVWFVSDRDDRAGDNGEAFFRHMLKEHPEYKVYFLLERTSPDYDRLKAIGHVLDLKSPFFKIVKYFADVILSSQIGGLLDSPGARSYEYFRDIMASTRHIFLQHGVILHDLSSWLWRYRNNLDGFVTSCPREHESLKAPAYAYSPDTLWLTGLPRFDRLTGKTCRQILIMPTWRHELTPRRNKRTGLWEGDGDFCDSDYFKFYNRLLNDQRLLAAAKARGYRLFFCPHPNFHQFLGRFEKNEMVEFCSPKTQYRDVFVASDLVVTDYSSAVFDFAYMRKPIVYAQFDRDTFFQGSQAIQHGYFEYERDGFGEIETTLNGTVERVVEYLRNDCKVKDLYLRRMNDFFAYDDHGGCERIFRKVVQLESRPAFRADT